MNPDPEVFDVDVAEVEVSTSKTNKPLKRKEKSKGNDEPKIKKKSPPRGDNIDDAETSDPDILFSSQIKRPSTKSKPLETQLSIDIAEEQRENAIIANEQRRNEKRNNESEMKEEDLSQITTALDMAIIIEPYNDCVPMVDSGGHLFTALKYRDDSSFVIMSDNSLYFVSQGRKFIIPEDLVRTAANKMLTPSTPSASFSSQQNSGETQTHALLESKIDQLLNEMESLRNQTKKSSQAKKSAAIDINEDLYEEPRIAHIDNYLLPLKTASEFYDFCKGMEEPDNTVRMF